MEYHLIIIGLLHIAALIFGIILAKGIK